MDSIILFLQIFHHPMILKHKASLGDYISGTYSNYHEDQEQPEPSYDEHFESLQLEQEKIVIRETQLEKLAIDLEKLMKLIFHKIYNREKEDKVLKRLMNLKEEALALNFKSIAQLTHLAIGKRIAILEIKRENFDDKKVFCQFDLRYIKLQSIKFNQLQIEKLEQKTFVFEPFINGSGFNFESCLYKNYHNQTLAAVDAKAALHEINTIWYKSYTEHKESKYKIAERWIKDVSMVALVLMLIIGFLTYYVLEVPLEPDENNFQSVMLKTTGILAPIIAVLSLTCTLLDVFQPIKNQSQIRIISKAIKQYITKLNQESEDCAVRRIWRVQVDLLWIQLKILGTMVEDEVIVDPILTMCTEKILNNKVGHTKSFLMNVRGSHLTRANHH